MNIENISKQLIFKHMIHTSSVKAMKKSLGLPELIVEQFFTSLKFKYSKLTLNEDWAGDYTNSIFRAKHN